MARSPSSVVTGFGVEIEVIFAFHEDLLVHVLKKRHLTRDHIVKEIPTAVKKAIGLRNHGSPPSYFDTRPGHRGWVLRIDQADSLKDWQAKGEERANVVGDCRTYWTEPLDIVQGILRSSKNYTIDVEVSTTSDAKERFSYKEWKVANDFTLAPAGKAELKAAMEDRITEKEVANWDNTGVEIVTPIMHRLGNDVEFDEIKLYLETLRGDETSNFGIFPSKYGAVHVHVGFADSALTLLTLQHLAFIMLQYEPLLVQLFPLHRNGSHVANVQRGLCREDTKSNQDRARMFELNKGESLSITMDDLGKGVFSTQSITHLCTMMQFDGPAPSPTYGTKGHLVNFINLAEAEKEYEGAKRTVEFRHHESTVDSDAIKMWVKLLLRICGAAERIASSDQNLSGGKEALENVSPAERQRRKHKPRSSKLDHVHIMEDLFELVGLRDSETLDARDRELRNYWQSRYDRYHDATVGLQPSPDFPDSPTQAEAGEQASRSDDDADDANDMEEQTTRSNVEPGAEGCAAGTESATLRDCCD